MGFLSPALLVGLLAALIPPIIHLIHRRRAVRVEFPALELIRRANKKTARQFRIKQLLLMLVRSLLLAALAFAMARPYFSREVEGVAAAAESGGTTVLVLDASWPMAFDFEGERLFDRARLQGGRLLDALGGTGQAALVVAGAKVTAPVAEPTADLGAVRAALDQTTLSQAHGSLADAVTRAYEVLSTAAPAGGRRVVVLTTPAGAAAPLPQPPPNSGIALLPVDAAGGAALDNRAIVDVALRPAPEVGQGMWRVDARVANFGATAVERLPIHLEVDGEVRVRGFVTLAPGESAVKSFNADVGEATAGAVPAAVVLESDALTTDDRVAFWLRPAPRLRLLAVNGDPRPTPQRDELFYLERAVGPGTQVGARVALTITQPDRLDDKALADADVVLLANVARLPAAAGTTLSAFVRGGGGLWVTMGDQVDPAHLNERIGPLLPRALREARQSGDAAASAEGRDRRLATLTQFERGHPVLRVFPDPARSSLARAGVAKYMLLDPAPDAAGEVVMALDEGAPFLLTRTVDQGRVALFTGSIDRDWGDVPIRPDFVPLVQQILRFLSRAANDAAPLHLVGATVPLPAEDPRVGRVQVRTPDGRLVGSDRPLVLGEAWSFTETAALGLYAVSPDPPLPGLETLPGFAVTVDPKGADLRAGEGRPEAARQNAAAAAEALAPQKRTELWHAALLGLFFLLAAEALLLWQRRTVVAPRRSADALGNAGAQ